MSSEPHRDTIFESVETTPQPIPLDRVRHDFEIMHNLYIGTNRVGSHHMYYFAINKVESKIKAILQWGELRNDPELLLLLCCLVEKYVPAKYDSTLDKPTIIIEGLRRCWSDLDETEINAALLLIQHYRNNGLIKVPTTAQRAHKYARKVWEFYFKF